MNIETESTPTKAQMQVAIAQTLALPFAYNAPVVVLDFSVNDQGEFEGKFKDAARPRVFSFNIEGQFVTFKPYAPGRMDSAEDWEEFSSGYSYRVDAGIGGNKKPQCVKPTAYNCGAACINIMKSCKTKTDDPTIKDRLKKLKTIGEDYAKTTPKTKAKKPPASTPELKPEPKKVAPEVKKQQSTNLVGDGTHEGTPRNAQEYYEAVIKTGKQITLKDARDTIDAVKYWTGSGSWNIRKDQKAGKPNERGDKIDEFIKNSTPYKGEIYRGLHFNSKEEALDWAKGGKDGLLGNQSAHASWTSDFKIASYFSNLNSSDENSAQVIIKSVNKSGVSIRNLSEFGGTNKTGVDEKEVVVSKGTRHKVKDEKEVVVSKETRHKVKNVKEENGIIIVEVEEVDSPPEKSSTKQEEVKTQQQFPSQKVGKLTPSVASIVEKQTQEKTKPLSIAQKNAQTIENLAKKAGVDVSKLVETTRKAGATEAQLLALKNGVANYMKAKETVPGSELKTTRSEEEGLTGDGSHEGMPRNAQEYYNLATKNGKQITLKEAQDTVDAIKDWAGDGYEEIRKDQKEGRVNERATLIDNYIRNSTPYKGEVYRGIHFGTKKEALNWAKGDKDGVLDNQGAHASWSSSLKTAEEFSDDFFIEEKRFPVVIKTINKSGASIKNLSSIKEEDEVIVLKDTRHRVKSVKEENGRIIVEAEEV